MKQARGFGRTARHAFAITMLAALAACGGGGGGDVAGPTLIDLTAANRDSVVHAAAVSLLPLSIFDSIPLLGGPGGVAVSRAGALAARERPLGLISDTRACAVSGNVTVTLDDHNNNGMIDLGEPLTVIFQNCQDNAYDVLNGTAVITITGATATTASFTFAMSQCSQQAVNGRHGLTLDGNLNGELAVLSQTSERWTMTAATPITATVHTHLFDDSVTLQTGFVEEEIADSATMHVTSNLRGTVTSNAAGGAFSMATDLAVGRLADEQYPHEGRVTISGNRGTMVITPQSATQVRVDLDPNDDGTFESSEVEDWDWLL